MKKTLAKFFFLLITGLVSSLPRVFSDPVKLNLTSPDGKLQCLIATENDQIFLSVKMNGTQILEPSPLIMSVDGIEITNGVKSGKIKNYSSHESYPLWGLHSVARDYYNAATIAISHNESGIKYSLEAKVFNDAVAFRFLVPGKKKTSRKPDEATIFKVPAGSTAWYHDLYMHYEGIHEKKLIDTVPSGQWAAPPLMVKLKDGKGYLAISEANLVNYAGMALQTDGKNGFTLRLGHSHPPSYPYILRYKKEDVERLSKIAEIKGTITTPWRVIMAGPDLNTMVNSDVLQNLCPPPDKKLFPAGIENEWVRPGRAVWKYLDGGGDGTLSVMKKFSKEAAELGFEYNILEGFWSRWPDDSIKALVDYSKELGVGIIVWKHSNTLYDQVARKELFQRCNKLGIAGLKIDFFDHEAKEVIDLYETIAREAAALKLVLIFHGANKPTGLSRTWPNILIYESVKGMEASKLTDRATHETTIPFTRMLAGPADYSVTHFGERRKNTTWVHQVATAAIYSAPVITYASTPAHILENTCAEMIKSIPSVWDETIVLAPSEIGELAIYAQRKGSAWFLSILNGLSARTVKIPLSFLGNGNYNTLVLHDDEDNPASAIVINGSANQNDTIDITLGEGGGFMTRFTLKQ
ncbi:MAG: glycoside hydrolase family 97 catalytic domain-containing protein [Bacteroidales bacterium]|nr:glycoside hydrolase family 97 catalytic domain-containing protein [Bacteroidales bacterium]